MLGFSNIFNIFINLNDSVHFIFFKNFVYHYMSDSTLYCKTCISVLHFFSSSNWTLLVEGNGSDLDVGLQVRVYCQTPQNHQV